jgi:hypothetical protein
MSNTSPVPDSGTRRTMPIDTPVQPLYTRAHAPLTMTSVREEG